MEKRSIKFTKGVLDIMFWGGIVVLLTLPFSLRFLGNHYSASIGEHYFLMLIVFGVSGICGVLIIRELRKMVTTVLNGSCFVSDNVMSLNTMAVISIVIIVLFIFKMFFLPTPATAIIILTFFIAALFSRVLAHVFARAIEYKEENDLTI